MVRKSLDYHRIPRRKATDGYGDYDREIDVSSLTFRKSLPYQGIARMNEEQLIAWRKKMTLEYGLEFADDGYGYCEREIDVATVIKKKKYKVIDKKKQGFLSPETYELIEKLKSKK